MSETTPMSESEYAAMSEAAYTAMKWHKRHGRPEVAARIKHLSDTGQDIPGNLLRTDGTNPMVEVAPDVEPPVAHGTTEDWQQYALAVTDFDEDVVKGLGREDVKRMLVGNGVISRDYLIGKKRS